MQTSAQDNKQAQQQAMQDMGEGVDSLSDRLSGSGSGFLSPDDLRHTLKNITGVQQGGGITDSRGLMQLLQKIIEIIIQLLSKFGSGSAFTENRSVSSGMPSHAQNQSGDTSKLEAAREQLRETLKDLDIEASFAPADTESAEKESPQTPVIPDDFSSTDFTAPLKPYDQQVRRRSRRPSYLITGIDEDRLDVARNKLKQTLGQLDMKASFGPADIESVEEESPQSPVLPDDFSSADFTAPVNKELYNGNARQRPYRPSKLLTGIDEKNALFAEKESPRTAEEKRQLAIDAEIAAYPYHRSAKKIAEAAAINQSPADTSPNWGPVTDFIEDLAGKTGLSADKEKGYLYDESTGLTAYLLQDAESMDNKDIRLVFGGTTSGHKTGGLLKRFLANLKFSYAQWKSNIQNALGLKIPANFQQAKDLTAAVVESLRAHPQYGDSQLTLSGHSKGGAEAAYAALSQTTPLEARIFSSAELHRKLLDTIPQENLNQATDLITGTNIKGDFIPNMRKILPTDIHPIGSTVTLPPAHAYNMERHDTFTKHIRHFAEAR